MNAGIFLHRLRMDGTFPTQTEKAQKVVRWLLKKIIPQFGIAVSIGSDDGLAFVAKVVQLMAKR
jgi:hypothetical protein